MFRLAIRHAMALLLAVSCQFASAAQFTDVDSELASNGYHLPASTTAWQRIALSGLADLQFAHVVADAPTATEENNQLALNHLNLLADIRINPLTLLHLNLHYGDNNRLSGVYLPAASGGVGWLSAVNTTAQNRLNLDEGYVLYTNREVSPVYIKFGMQYLDVGHYSDPYTSFPSLTQVLTQTSKNALASGFYANNGLYGSAALFRGAIDHQSKNHFNSYTFKMGYRHAWEHYKLGGEVSYLRDVRDIIHNARDGNPWLKQYFISDLSSDSSFGKRHGLVVMRMMEDWGAWHGEAVYSEVLGRLNGVRTEPQILSLSGVFDFKLFDHPQNLHGQFETVSQHDAVMLFGKRYAGGYLWQLNSNADLTLDYAYYKGTANTPTSFAGNADNLHLLLLGVQLRI